MAEATIERVQERGDRQRYNTRHGRTTVGSRERLLGWPMIIVARYLGRE